jgi:hypothetical protein
VVVIIAPQILGVKAASWQTVNNDYHLNEDSDWDVNVWHSELGDNDYDPPDASFAYTSRDMRSIQQWGNTEFVQGYKPIWDYPVPVPHGETFDPLILIHSIQLSANAKLTDLLNAYGAANIYINLWCMFTTAVGNGGPGGSGLQHMEIIIYLGEYGPSKECSPGDYSLRTNTDGTYTWYFAGYRVPSDIGTSYASNTINVNSIIAREADKYGITKYDLANGGVVGITFGVEVNNAYLAANWDYVNLQDGGDPPLSMLSYDDSTDMYFDGVPFYIDSNYAGATSSIVDLFPGTYTLEVPSYNGAFEYFDVDGTPVYDNPATITVEDETVNIVVHYSSIPTFSVTFDAYDMMGAYDEVYPNVYIDDVWAGTAPFTTSLTAGYHTITFEDPIFDEYNSLTVQFDWMEDTASSNTYYNGAPILINDATTVTAIYYLPMRYRQ